jgi:hypothetical protein
MDFRLSIALSLVLVTACSHTDARRVDTASARSVAPDVHQRSPTGPDTAAAPIQVDRPVLVAFFAVTQAQVDSSDDIGEALSDFQHYLPGIKSGLDSIGVALREQYTDTVRYIANGRAQLWVPPKESADVGYLLLRPDGEPSVLYAVATTDDVLDQVKEWLGRSKP